MTGLEMGEKTFEVVRGSGGRLACDRWGLIEVTGSDRQDWLHNLVTNVIKSLRPGEGRYAFAINVQGRTLFDMYVLVREDRLWLDVDRRWLDAAMTHLDKYHIVEDVKLADRSGEFFRRTVVGAACAQVCADLGFDADFGAWQDGGHHVLTAGGAECLVYRSDLAALPRVEFILPSGHADAAAAVDAACDARRCAVLDDEVYNALRIENGEPRSVDDIDEQVIPPETLMIERGISYVKGCYLGQEVIERMRSRGVQARRLAGIRTEGEDVPPKDAAVLASGKEIGRITSACKSPTLGAVLALGYIKPMLLPADNAVRVRLDDEREVDGAVVDVPLAQWGT